jgi:hypothetical protein
MSVRAIAPATALVALLLLTTAGLAWAQNEPPRTAALEAATERFEAGKRLFREGTKEHNPSKIERAYFEFKAAFAIYPGRGTLLNLVETELATGRSLDGMRHIREYARTFGAPEQHSDYHRTFEAQWGAAFNATGHLEIEAPTGLRVVVDGKDEMVVTPLASPIDVTAGHHVVELVGSETLRDEADAAAGSMTKLTFAPPQPSPSAAPVVPAAPSEPTPVVNIGKAPAETPPPPPPPPPPRFWTPPRLLGTVVGVAGLAALGAGAAFAIQANQDSDRASSLASGLGPSGCVMAQSQSCIDLQSARDDQSRNHTLNLVFVTIGAAAVVTGAALIFWPAQARSRTALAPAFLPGGGGLQLRGEI